MRHDVTNDVIKNIRRAFGAPKNFLCKVICVFPVQKYTTQFFFLVRGSPALQTFLTPVQVYMSPNE